MTKTCQIKSGLFRCEDEAGGLCQYCGRQFCPKHGVFLDEGQEVCNRKNCVAKREDLVRHLSYKGIVTARNEAAQCGAYGCGDTLSDQCARCKGYFCTRHVDAREEIIVENKLRLPRMSTLCRHCWERRPIWTRV